MTIDFDQFFMFKMFGDPLVLFGDPPKNCLVTPLVTSLVTPFGDPQWRSPKVTKKNTMCQNGQFCQLLDTQPEQKRG